MTDQIPAADIPFQRDTKLVQSIKDLAEKRLPFSAINLGPDIQVPGRCLRLCHRADRRAWEQALDQLPKEVADRLVAGRQGDPGTGEAAVAKQQAKIAADADVELMTFPPRKSFYELLSEELSEPSSWACSDC